MLTIFKFTISCFPGGASGKDPTCQCRRRKRRGFDPWVGKILWKRSWQLSLVWQPSLVFLPGESHGQRSLSGYSLQGHSEVDTTEVMFISVQSRPTLCDPMNRSTPGLPVHYQLPEFTQIHVHRVSDAIPPSHPRSSPSPPAPNPSQHQSLFHESSLRMRWPKYWSFSFSIIPSKEIPGLISFRMDWSDLLAVRGTFKSLLQHHSSKASILRHSAFFTIQLSHPYMTTGKTIALTRWTLVSKVMSLFEYAI